MKKALALSIVCFIFMIMAERIGVLVGTQGLDVIPAFIVICILGLLFFLVASLVICSGSEKKELESIENSICIALNKNTDKLIRELRKQRTAEKQWEEKTEKTEKTIQK